MEWSSNELIEQELLAGASYERICNWLEKNAATNAPAASYDYFNLRQKYEPIWAAGESNALKMSVCLYGRDQDTLKHLFQSDLPTHFKEAILTNVSFVRDAGLYSHGSGLTEDDICKLYENLQSDPDDQLFFKIFQNPAISEDFIERLFRQEKPYQKISELHLFRIFRILFSGRTNNYFAQNQHKYESNDALRQDAKYLANRLIKFIPKIGSIGKNADLIEFCHWQTTFVISNFLESTGELDTDGIADEKTLLLFNGQNDEVEKNHDQLELIRIQSELGDRAFSGLLPNGSKKQLSELAQSNYARMRAIYYRNADLSQIYGLEPLDLERFFENLPMDCIRLAVDREEEPPKSLSKKSRKAIASISGLLKMDNVTFASALALNERHYQSKHSRACLREICRVGDLLGCTLPWPLGNGMCKDLFQAKCLEIRKKIPEYFLDETPEVEQAEKIDGIRIQVSDARSLIDEQINEQSSSNKEMHAQIRTITQKLEDQEIQLKQIAANISSSTEYLDLQIKKPNDILARVLFGIPVLGHFLKLLFR